MKSATAMVFGIAVLIAVSWSVFRKTVYVQSAPAPATAAAVPVVDHAEAETEAIVEAVDGGVQRSSPGGWSAVSIGDRLHVDDSLRTAKGARADVRIGERSHISIAQGSQIVVRELSEKVHRLKLTRGYVRVDYAPDGERVLRIEGEGDDAVAETRSARFSVLSTGRSIAIATDEGTVAVKAKGQEVAVAAGFETVVSTGAAPALPQPIPRKLLLKVANALPAPVAETCVDVSGSAPPGSEVTVDGHPTDLASDGSFTARVARAEAGSEVVVAIRDPAGRTTSRTVPCLGEIGGVRDVALRWLRKPK
jgi:hypothetical protein